MAQFTVIKFTNMSPLHIGMGRDTYDVSDTTLQADTLTAALAAMRAQNGKSADVKEFLESFTLSSAFPYSGDTIFLPKATGKLAVTVKGRKEEEYRKRLKKVKYVALLLWLQLASGATIEVEEAQLQGEYLTDKASGEFKEFTKKVMTQRVMVSRAGQDAVPFTFMWQFFAPGAGLYCLLQCNDEQRRQEIVALFRELGEQGVGSDRNVGGGHFGIDESRLDLPAVEEANAIMTLSTFIPTRDEVSQLNLSVAKYQLLRRGGFMAGSENASLRHLRKNTVYMFAPGAVFPCAASVQGKVVDLKPRWNAPGLHPVYRSGRVMIFPIKTKTENS